MTRLQAPNFKQIQSLHDQMFKSDPRRLYRLNFCHADLLVI